MIQIALQFGKSKRTVGKSRRPLLLTSTTILPGYLVLNRHPQHDMKAWHELSSFEKCGRRSRGNAVINKYLNMFFVVKNKINVIAKIKFNND